MSVLRDCFLPSGTGDENWIIEILIMNEELFTVEWSNKQKCFHIDFLSKTLQKNTEDCLNSDHSDWILIGLFKSWQECEILCDEMRESRAEAYS